MLRKIHLHGPLAEVAGWKTAEFDVDTPLALTSALRSQVKPFRSFCDQHKVAFVLVDQNSQAQSLSHDDFTLQFGSTTDIHLVPEVEGAGFEAAAIIGAFKAGAYLTALAYIAVNIAIAVAVGLVIQALTPQPKLNRESSRPEENPSFIYNGPVNVVEQGYAVPLVYGIHMTGSIVVSAGVRAEDINYTPSQVPVAPGVIPRVIPPVAWQWGA